MPGQQRTAVLDVAGVHWASGLAVTESVLGRRPGVLRVDASSTTSSPRCCPLTRPPRSPGSGARGRRVAFVGDGVNGAPALAIADLGIAIGAGTDVAVESADVVLMRSDVLDVPLALTVGRATRCKMRQILAWAVGCSAIALPIAAGVFAPLGLVLRPEIAAVSMSGSSVLVAVNALLLKRLRLPAAPAVPEPRTAAAPAPSR